MNKAALPFALLLAFAGPAARAQVHVHIDLGLPLLPPLVTVSPGVQVVEGFNDEVFLYGGWYWCRRPDGWYRSRTPRDHFMWIEGRRVPGPLVRVPAGRYRNWHHEEHREMARERREERREVRHEERREEHREAVREHHEEKRREHEERREEKRREH